MRAAYGSASESCDSSHSAFNFETTVCPMSAVRPKVSGKAAPSPSGGIVNEKLRASLPPPTR